VTANPAISTTRPPSEAPPTSQIGVLRWLKENLFGTIPNTLVTLISGTLIFVLIRALIRFLFEESDWTVVTNNLTLFMIGRYPRPEAWRTIASLMIVVGLGAASLIFWRRRRITVRRILTVLWFLSVPVIWMVLAGFDVATLISMAIILALGIAIALFWENQLVRQGLLMLGLISIPGLWLGLAGFSIPALISMGIVLGLSILIALIRSFDHPARLMLLVPFALLHLSVSAIWVVVSIFPGPTVLPVVNTQLWSGLLLTIMLTVIGITASFPLGILLALGRRSDLPIIRILSTTYIEVVRGVPLISLLFLAAVMLPLFLGFEIDIVLRAMAAVTLFSAAYLAENIRGGLQAIPRGQVEAAQALGLNPILVMGLVVLPQALRIVIPAIVGQFISLFKDTTLVSIITLLDLLGITDAALGQNPSFQFHKPEAYLFIGSIYFLFSYSLSQVARRIESSSSAMGGTRNL
jgi:general L-amino acid transport system permease protein